MQKKILGTYLIIILITLLISTLFSWGRVKDYFFNRVEKESEAKIVLLLDLLIDEQKTDADSLQAFAIKYATKIDSRITIVDEIGAVVAESDLDKNEMDNHLNRVEIAQSLKSGEISSSFRYSKTMKSYYQYVAVPFTIAEFYGVLRIATPLLEVEDIIYDMLIMVILGTLIGSIFAFLVAYLITNKLMSPIKELTEAAIRISDGAYDGKIFVSQKDEIGQLAVAFNNMTMKLNTNLWELEHKNAELESILGSMRNGLIVIDPDFKIVLHNEPFIHLLNIKETEIDGRLFYEVTRNLVIFELIEKCAELDEMIVKEAKTYDAGGEKIFLIYANPIKSHVEKTRNLGVLLTVQDITQMRKLENMRSDFVSNVTHELKTPLTSIRGFVDTLKNGAIDDPQVAPRFLEIIDIEAERLESLIDDILILSEIEAMVGDKNVGNYKLQEIIQEVIEILEPEAKEKNIGMILQLDEEVASFRCNKNRIKQLLINIVGNSIKYTDKGTVTISLREEFKFIVLEVEDTGIGIEEQHISRLFERFYRVDKGRSRSKGGTGLGLSIVKHIVELYNGKIKVESKVGEGTKIIIRFPS
ncbi:MAG: HAMP domain-containing protein [Vallitaleaceae bacterium]|nr:HAMP domain-containing protein [Vallitaleaceae bacterium]